MSGDITLSGTPEGGSEATGEYGRAPPAEDGADLVAAEAAVAAEPVAAADPVLAADGPTLAEAVPGSLFRPTMRDGSSASETGMTVPSRPLETQPEIPVEGGTVPCDGPDAEADQALILGPSGQGETDAGGDPVAQGPDGTAAPPVAADLIDGTSLFGDRAAMWWGNPSEVGAGYGIDPQHADLCLCDETSLAAGQDAPDLAS